MQSYDFYAELKNTNNILMELPCFRQLSDDNELLHERIQSLKATIEYLESKNRRLSSKIVKYKTFYKKSKKVPRKNQLLSNVIDLVSDDDSDDNVPVVVDIKQEKVVVQEAKGDQDQEEIVQDQEEVVQDQEEVVQDQEEVVQEEVIEYEIVEVVEEAEGVQDVVEGEEAEEEEVVEGEEEVEEVVEGEEAEKEEEVVEDEEAEGDQEETEAEEEEVVEGEEAEVEEEEAEEVVEVEEAEAEGEEEDAEVYDIEINGKTYYVQNEKDSPIYEADENGDISMEVGVYKKGVPTFF